MELAYNEEEVSRLVRVDIVMPSPFPGMDPYLEQPGFWHMFHDRLIVHAADILTETLEPRYEVIFDDNIYLHELSAEERGYFVGRPDLGVVRASAVKTSLIATAGSGAPAYGYAIAAVDELREAFIEIRDRAGGGLVTAIELLSPSNKYPGADRDQYMVKRLRYFKSNTHFIEIDLLRGGPRMPLEGMPPCDYCVIVRRADEHPRVGIWPLTLRDQLPTIPIPLRSPDSDGSLDLQSLLQRVYDAGRYGNKIYAGQPEPALKAEDRAWAESILAQGRGK